MEVLQQAVFLASLSFSPTFVRSVIKNLIVDQKKPFPIMHNTTMTIPLTRIDLNLNG